jgi:hypothetical protein
MAKFIDFAEIRERLPIEDAAEMLPVKWERSGQQLRASCPIHGGDRALVVTPSKGLFICQSAPPRSNGKQPGGDCVALTAHVMESSSYEAAEYLAKQIGMVARNSSSYCDSESNSNSNTVSKDRATLPPAKTPQKVEAKPERSFDPAAFEAKLVYNEEVRALGYSQEDAAAFGIGWHPTHKAVFKAARYGSGATAGFWKHIDGKWVAPKQGWLPDASNVVPLRRPA